MLVSSAGEVPRDIMMYSDTEAILEYVETINLELITSGMSMTTGWVGKNVTTRCRVPGADEIAQARKVQSVKSSVCNEINEDVDIYILFSSGSDV